MEETNRIPCVYTSSSSVRGGNATRMASSAYRREVEGRTGSFTHKRNGILNLPYPYRQKSLYAGQIYGGRRECDGGQRRERDGKRRGRRREGGKFANGGEGSLSLLP